MNNALCGEKENASGRRKLWSEDQKVGAGKVPDAKSGRGLRTGVKSSRRAG